MGIFSEHEATCFNKYTQGFLEVVGIYSRGILKLNAVLLLLLLMFLNIYLLIFISSACMHLSVQGGKKSVSDLLDWSCNCCESSEVGTRN